MDGTVIQNHNGFKSLEDILKNKEFIFKYSELREKAKKDILIYLTR
jgi:hypothetical protein